MNIPAYLQFAAAIPVYGLAVYYLYQASKVSRFVFLALAVAIVYGLTVELFEIRETHEYFYDHFAIMVGEFPYWVPWTVAASWGILLWITMSTTVRLGLPWYQSALVDGLLALSLDFFIDPVFSSNRLVERVGQECAVGSFPPGDAVGIGIWVWCVPPTEKELWFGIPIANFFSWFVVVVSFSAGVGWVRKRYHAEDRGALSQLLLLVVVGLAAVLTTFVLSRAFLAITQNLSIGRWVLGALCGLPLFFLLRAGYQRRIHGKMNRSLLLFPALCAVSSLGVCFATPISSERPILPLVVLLLGVLSLGLFSWQALAQRIFRHE